MSFYTRTNGYETDDENDMPNINTSPSEKMNDEYYNDHITGRSFLVYDFESACKAFTLATINQNNTQSDPRYWLHRANMYYLIDKLSDLDLAW
jgi:hypothetical protein